MLLREGRHKLEPPTESLPRKCERKQARSRAKLKPKGPVEANKMMSQRALGIVAHKKKRPPTTNSVRKQHHPWKWPRTLVHTPSVSAFRRGVDLYLSLGLLRGRMDLVTGWLLQLLGRLWGTLVLRREMGTVIPGIVACGVRVEGSGSDVTSKAKQQQT